MRWSVSKSDLITDRKPGISGFMRLRNEAYLLDTAIETHVEGLDELIIVYNDCDDATPDICHAWQERMPDKIKVYEYEPKIIPLGNEAAKKIDPSDEASLANYYNFAFCKTNHEIVIKIDGDHAGDATRFSKSCDKVRKHLKRDEKWPIFGLNVTDTAKGVAVYNFYNHEPHIVGDRIGPPPFTTGDQSFYYVDDKTWHLTDADFGYEKMPLQHKKRARLSHNAFLFFHCKGFKEDFGTGNWIIEESDERKTWADNVSNLDWKNVASIEEIANHNPSYFAGFDYKKEFAALFPDRKLYTNSVKLKKSPILIAAFKNRLLELGS